MSVGVEALFTSALGLQPPWVVEDVLLDVASKRIDFEVRCDGTLLSCPACGAASQPVHDRLRRKWRHLDFFQFEAWLHADVPRVACGELPVRQAGALLRCSDKQLWRRIEFYVDQARASESFEGVQIVGIDETSVRRGQHYITVVHDLHAKRLLFAAEGRDHQTVVDFAADLKAHGGDPAEVRHVCMDMSAAYAKGATLALPAAAISYDRFHVIAMAIQAMDDVRREELRAEPAQVAAALQGADPETRRNLLWGMRKNPVGWTAAQTDAMYWLQRSALKSARAWRLRMALREVYARARQHNSAEQAASDLKAWTSWARRCRLEPFKKLATTIKERFDAVVRGMLDHRSNAFVESMNGQLQQAKRAARGYRTAKNFIAIAYLRLSRLKNLPAHPFSPAAAVS